MTLALEGPPLRFADLPVLWPAGLRPNEREWITRNLTAGELRRGEWRLEGELPAGEGEQGAAAAVAAAPRLTGFSGTAEAADATVHWLRPIPPVARVDATASFSAGEILVRARGGRQMAAAEGARATGIEAREATVRFFALDEATAQMEVTAGLAGPLPEMLALVKHPRLKLFERRPLDIAATAGQAEGRLTIGLPLLADLPMELLRVKASARVAEARLTDVVAGQALERAALALEVDQDGLRLTGQGVMAEAPLRLDLAMDFRAGAPAQVTERATIAVPRAEPPTLAAFGLDVAGFMEGAATGLDLRYERRRSGQGQVAIRGELREARLMLEPVNFAKPVGAPALVEAVLRLQGEALAGVDGLRLEGADFALRGRAEFGAGSRLDRLVIAEGSRLGGSRFGGEIRRPAREGGPWAVTLRGPLLDLRPILSAPSPEAARQAAAARRPPPPPPDSGQGGGASYAFDLRFDRATTGEGRTLLGLGATALVDGRGLLREAQGGGRTGGGGGGPQHGGAFEVTLTPRGRGERHLRLTAEDGGALLHALDLADAIQGGRLTVTGIYPELRPGSPLQGVAELDRFVVRDAPGFAKLLQAMTLYGVLEALQGGTGLVFTRLVASFALTREALELADARAFSASLGLTAKGRIWRQQGVVEVEGTLVPAYFFNQLLGNIPLLGRLFSPERGGGVFAATYRVQGPLSDPTVTVNPLAALTPGFLRGIFGDSGGGGGAAAPRGAGPQVPGGR
jgi:hypothetical protein